MSQFDLSGKVAIVTGGNGGIGLGCARGLAGAGATVAVVGRNAEKSAQAVKELESKGGKAIAVEADVSQGAAVEAMVAAVALPARNASPPSTAGPTTSASTRHADCCGRSNRSTATRSRGPT